MRLTTPSCRLGGTILARMRQWQLSGSTAGCAIGLPAFGDGPALCRKRSRWSTRPSRCLPPTTSIEQRQNSPCHCFLNPLLPIGVKTWDAIDEAIRLRDKVLLILSKNAIGSEWVEDE